MPELRQSELALAFAFSRSAAAAYRDAAGVVQLAPVDAPRFDHGQDGTPLGLLVTAGHDLGQEDRLSLDPLILSAELVESDKADERACTVLHAFQPEGSELVEYRAWYSRDAARTVDALMRQPGHHRKIGVVAGFRPNKGGYVRYRSRDWVLTGFVAAGAGVLGDGSGIAGRPLITGGAELVDG